MILITDLQHFWHKLTNKNRNRPQLVLDATESLPSIPEDVKPDNSISSLVYKLSESKILTATIWVTDIRNRPAMNEVWSAWVDKANLPARACVEAKLADPACLVEIMVVAAK